MASHTGETRSHLYMVRVWTEQIDEERVEWRGKVQRVLNGETIYFRDWETMLAFLMDKAPIASKPQPEEN